MIRVSGEGAGAALATLAGKLPEPRRATFCRFCEAHGAILDDGLALWMPGPASATGEDVAELHVHGGRAVVAAMLDCLGLIPGLRPAQAGEFTRRAFENGRIDLAEAEGLADLLAAETESQRQAALVLAEGALGKAVGRWQRVILEASARIEAELDFSDEGDVAADKRDIALLVPLAQEMAAMLASPPAERLRDGVRVVLAGPPNAGKSSLFNVLAGRHAAIVSEVAGTTRDRIEAPVVIDGVPLLLIDTAGLHALVADAVEQSGIALTGEAIDQADIVLWLGAPDQAPARALVVAAKADLGNLGSGLRVSSVTGQGLAGLRAELLARALAMLPKPGTLALNARHRAILAEVVRELRATADAVDPLLAAEHLRLARARLDAITGRASTEDMLDALFGGFCIGK